MEIKVNVKIEDAHGSRYQTEVITEEDIFKLISARLKDFYNDGYNEIEISTHTIEGIDL